MRYSDSPRQARPQAQPQARPQVKPLEMPDRDPTTPRPALDLSRGRHKPDVPDSPREEREQQEALRREVELVHGPGEVRLGEGELAVLCLVRDGRPYVETFVEHYLDMGAKHLVFLDNGSTDGTVEALERYKQNVTVLQTTLPYKRYNVSMKRYLIERYGRGRWTLSVDIDELFGWPYQGVVGLKDLLGYLSERGHTAVVAQMLDVFPEGPVADAESPGGSLKDAHRFYDLSHVRAQSYHDIGEVGNVLGNEEIEIYKGGIQVPVFDVAPLLTKHPLIFFDGQVKPMDLSDHWTTNARIADFSCVLLHYKFVGGLRGHVRRALERQNYPNRFGKYEKYREVLDKTPALRVRRGTSRELTSVDDLVANRFLVVSEEYMKLVTRLGGAEKQIGTLLAACREVGVQRARAELLRRRVDELEPLVEESREAAREARRRAEEAGAWMRAVQTSRGWRVLTALGRLKDLAKRFAKRALGLSV